MLLPAISMTLILGGCATTSENNLTSKEKDVVVAKLEKEQSMVCRKSQSLGSHMRTRRCVTKEQYEKEKLEAQERARELNRSSNILNTLGSDE